MLQFSGLFRLFDLVSGILGIGRGITSETDRQTAILPEVSFPSVLKCL